MGGGGIEVGKGSREGRWGRRSRGERGEEKGREVAKRKEEGEGGGEGGGERGVIYFNG